MWLDLARDSRKAASELVLSGRFRSAVARAYFAAYSRVSDELVRAGVTMPSGREGPSHTRLKPMVERNLTCLKLDKRIWLSRAIGRLYALRLYADYQPSITVDAREAKEAISLMKKVFDAF